jgi:phosphate transport system ATP-binding protein
MTDLRTSFLLAAAAADRPARPSPRPKLSARGVDFFYGAEQALKGIDLDVPERKITALIGPPAAASPTLLRVFNRIYSLYPGQRAAGEVRLDGEDILDPRYSLNRLRGKVGMVFQKPVPFPMSIQDNVAYGIRHHERLGKAEMAERVELALAPGRALGRGQGQAEEQCARTVRAASSSACASRVQVGPAAGGAAVRRARPSALDPIATGKIEQLFAELKQQFTILIVTHNMQQAARCSDYTAFMYLGELVERGVTEMLFTTPSTRKQTETILRGGSGEFFERTHRQELRLRTRAPVRRDRPDGQDRARAARRRRWTCSCGATPRPRSAWSPTTRRSTSSNTRSATTCCACLALRQPMARDLREVYGALRIASDIERIGDYAANVAKRSIVLNAERTGRPGARPAGPGGHREGPGARCTGCLRPARRRPGDGGARARCRARRCSTPRCSASC